MNFDRRAAPAEARRFSRSLVRRVLEGGEPLESPDLAQDPRFAGFESALQLGGLAVLAVPLCQGGQAWGALYLERRGGGFPPEARRFAVELAETAGLFLRRAVERERTVERARSLERDLFAKHDFCGIVTADPKMLGLLRVVAQVADTEAAVLIQGESGTGKELVAQALHMNSSRAPKPFVALHCAALAPSVLESELFGHVRGAYTGAERERKGRLASADGGTLLLDEVAEMPLEVQVKLLRFLESGEIQRVGSDEVETLDVRVLAATLADLGARAKAGRFREDLDFRLRVLELRVPPLRERLGDVRLLLEHFLRRHWKRPGEQPRWSARAEAALLAHDWPGNVRELEHLVQRACALATSPELDLGLLPPELERPAATGSPAFPTLDNAGLNAAKKAAHHEVERAFATELMASHGGNVSQAARAAGMQRGNLQKMLRRHRDAGAAKREQEKRSSSVLSDRPNERVPWLRKGCQVMSSIVCPRCRKRNAEFNRACASCGAPLPRDSASAAPAAGRHEGTASFGETVEETLRDDSLLGQQRGPYRLLELLGRGAMGSVYRAEAAAGGRQVALKAVISPRPDTLPAIRREIHALSRLRHPGIVRIRQHGLHEGCPWIAMELLHGPTLRQWGQGTLAPGLVQRLSVVRRLCGALAYLHGEGLVHRDLKPENILVRRGGQPVLVDFGLASAFSGRVSREALEGSALASGTLPYMAPEQLRGDLLDARADLYGLGCILYELLTGRPPFVRVRAWELAEAHLFEAPVPPSEVSAEVRGHRDAEQFDALVLELLAKEPARRRGHASDVAAALERLGAENGFPARAPRPRAYL